MKRDFGKMKDGTQVSLYVLENDRIRMAVTDYGATLVELTEKTVGIDVVLGFDDVEGYMRQDGSYIGASVGRTANRIAKGTFTLHDQTYHLPVNNNGNSLHGGIEGFDKKLFNARKEENKVIFTRLSVDGEEGYPGNLMTNITYTLLTDGISIEVSGMADRDTLFAYTNHSYFNLDGSDDAMHHLIRIHADKCGYSDADGLMTGTLEPVADTVMDFRTFHTPAERIDNDDEQLKRANGYDHFYSVDGKGFRPMVECRGKKLALTMESDFPGFHFYTANYLNGIAGKNGKRYERRCAVCFEGEYYPNAINYENMEKPILRSGEISKHTIIYRVKPIDEEGE